MSQSLSVRHVPVPQANKLEKVVFVVDAVDAGANTDNALAVALNMSARQGSYYSTAAQSLGFVESDNNTPRSWHLTELGVQILTSNGSERARLVFAAVNASESAQAAVGDGELDETLAATTTARRQASGSAWVDQATSPEFAELLEAGVEPIRKAAAQASQIAVAQREEAAARSKGDEPRASCGGCWMELPVSGVCPDCS